MLWLAGRVAVEVDNVRIGPWAGFQSAPVGMGPNHGRFAVGLLSLLCAIGCLLSVVGVIALPLM